MIKQFAFILISVFALTFHAVAYSAKAPSLHSQSWILVDRLTNTVLAANNELKVAEYYGFTYSSAYVKIYKEISLSIYN